MKSYGKGDGDEEISFMFHIYFGNGTCILCNSTWNRHDNRDYQIFSSLYVSIADVINAEQRGQLFIYKDVHVIWSGMAINVLVTVQCTTFDLLIGYDTRMILEGIIFVNFNVPVSVNVELPITVRGRIIPDAGIFNNFRLEGISLWQPERF